MAVFYIFIGAIAIVHCASEAPDSLRSSDSRSVGLSISSTKNDSGQWTDSTRTENSSALHSITMDVQHDITEYDGRGVIHIQGSIRKGRDQFSRKEKLENGSGGDCTEGCGGRDKIKAEGEINEGTGNGRKLQQEKKSTDEVGESEKGMVFHSRAGSNVIISNNGRTIKKKNIYDWANGAAFTNRPLKNDELFEVILDRQGSEFVDCFGIGVLTVRPEDFELRGEAYKSPHAWMYHDSTIYSNGTYISDYGVNLDCLPAGTRFGVMKKSSGDVHFFVNGVDKGSAISGISGPVYGVADLWGSAEKITILKP